MILTSPLKCAKAGFNYISKQKFDLEKRYYVVPPSLPGLNALIGIGFVVGGECVDGGVSCLRQENCRRPYE